MMIHLVFIIVELCNNSGKAWEKKEYNKISFSSLYSFAIFDDDFVKIEKMRNMKRIGGFVEWIWNTDEEEEETQHNKQHTRY